MHVCMYAATCLRVCLCVCLYGMYIGMHLCVYVYMYVLMNLCILWHLLCIYTHRQKLWSYFEYLCRLSIVESIPENLTFPSGSPSHGSTYDAWMSLLSAASKSVDIASYYWTLRGHGNISDSTDKQVARGKYTKSTFYNY